MASLAEYEWALAKLRRRWKDFEDAGWTGADLTACALKRYGHHGLALYLRPNQDVGQIWPWCCELLGSQLANGQRSRLLYWRTAPECLLTFWHGSEVVPAEVVEFRARVIQ